jgi:hypothetical protein
LARVHTFRFDVHVGYMRDAGDYHRRGGHLAEDSDDRTWEMEGIAMNESDKKGEWVSAYINRHGIKKPIDSYTKQAKLSKTWDCCMLCYQHTGKYDAKALGTELSVIKNMWICRNHLGSKGLYRKIAAIQLKAKKVKP